VRLRLVISTIAIVLVVLASLAVPVVAIVYDSGEEQLSSRVEEAASSLETDLNAEYRQGGTVDYAAAARDLPNGIEIQVVDRNGVIFESLTGAEAKDPRLRILANGDRVEVYTTLGPLDDTLQGQLNVLVALTIGALIAAAALAWVQARQLAQPLERLAARAARIGDGDFSRTPLAETHISEIDRIGAALDTSAERVETMLANERHFTADATHQLRTGITGIAMRFEILSMGPDHDVRTEAHAGLAQTDQLNATIDELLAATRNRSTQERQPFDLANLVNDHADEWHPRFANARRHISVITAAPSPIVFGTKGLAGQVVDILIDNALKHGDGAVTLMIDGPSVVVIDQGKGMSPDKLRTVFHGPVDPAAKHGRGLALARRLAQVDGAALDVVGNQPLRIRYRLVRADRDGEAAAEDAPAMLG
jgi:signal transduction histidine kinase